LASELVARNDLHETGLRLRESELRLLAKLAEVKADLVKRPFGAVGIQTLIILGAVIASVKLAH
jgi:hypothetical protein